eukprot:XP_001693467.1 predicted protein [Chlamydomonas reinhardtii]
MAPPWPRPKPSWLPLLGSPVAPDARKYHPAQCAAPASLRLADEVRCREADVLRGVVLCWGEATVRVGPGDCVRVW